jgi:hypothetical protein
VEARALRALGGAAEARGALDRFLEGDPLDVRARRLAGELGAGTPASALPSAPPLAPARADGGAAGDGVRYVATPDQGGLDAPDLGIKARWPISWRVLAVTGGLDGALAANLATGRVLLDDGSADRATATLLAQRAPGAGARAALLKEGARKVFAGAKLKTLPPLLPGSRRQQWSESQMGAARTGEVTTLVRGDVVYTLVLNASVATYPKLRDEFAVFVRSLGAEPSPPPSPPSPPSPSSPPPSR